MMQPVATQTADLPPGSDVDASSEPRKEVDIVEEYLRHAGARQFGHAGGRSLYDHLIGTRDILRRWLQPRWLQYAGAVHSIYSNDVYRKQLVRLSRRHEVSAIVGERAERLAYLFCALSRESFFGAIDAVDRLSGDGMMVKRAVGREAGEWLNCQEASHLLVLHMANLAEQSRGPSGEPGRWLARISRLGAKLDETQMLIPPAFASCTRIVDPKQEERAREEYLAGLAVVSSEEATAHFASASDACPWIAEPLVASAYLAVQHGDLAGGRSWIVDARRRLIDLGTAWDPRLGYEDWLQLISGIEALAFEREAASPLPPFDLVRAANVLGSREPASAKVVRGPAPDPDATRDRGLDRFYRYVETLGRDGPTKGGRHYPDLSSKPWYDASAFPLVHDIIAHSETIRSEILAAQGDGFHRESERIKRRGSWDVLMLFERGRKNPENCSRCPVTTGLIEAHDTMRTHSGLIYFSRMKPDTHIAAHRGPTNIRLRCHLGIDIPDGDAACASATKRGVGSRANASCSTTTSNMRPGITRHGRGSC